MRSRGLCDEPEGVEVGVFGVVGAGGDVEGAAIFAGGPGADFPGLPLAGDLVGFEVGGAGAFAILVVDAQGEGGALGGWGAFSADEEGVFFAGGEVPGVGELVLDDPAGAGDGLRRAVGGAFDFFQRTGAGIELGGVEEAIGAGGGRFEFFGEVGGGAALLEGGEVIAPGEELLSRCRLRGPGRCRRLWRSWRIRGRRAKS